MDLVILGDTHTVEREVEEVRTYFFVAPKLQTASSHCNQHPPELQSSTGSGFTFSVPFFYDGLTFVGNDTFVRCAEEKQRHGTCSSLSICVEAGTTWYIYLERVFPSNYIKVGSSLKQIINMVLNNECNVIASEESIIRSVALLDGSFHNENFTMGTKRLTKEPHGILTNNHDREFSDIVNWVVQALFFGEKEGLEKDLRRCRNNTAATPHHVSDLRFLNAVFCVGNYEEILVGNLGNPHQRGRNALNHGSGMLYAIPFGNLDKSVLADPVDSHMLAKIRNETALRCGVLVPRNFEGTVTGSNTLVGMGVDYCRALASAIFIGNSNALHFSTFLDGDSSIMALSNRTIDVLVGERVQQKYDLEISPMGGGGGLHFSIPYYYGKESITGNVSLYSVATQEGDVMFASFVNSIVLGTIYADDNFITKVNSEQMPFVSIFGRELKWCLKDAIAYSGSYGEIYTRNFGVNASKYRGRNALNRGGPLLLSIQ